MGQGHQGRLVILTGPSCVGKGPLHKALDRLEPDLHARLRPVVLYNSRQARPGEREGVDYYFRSREEVAALRNRDRYVVMEVRGDLQALDLEELEGHLEEGDAFFEGNPYIAKLLLTHRRLTDVERLSVFLSPLSRVEVEFLSERDRHVQLGELVANVMRRKLLRRTRRYKGELSLPDLEDIERRATTAYTELQEAWRCDLVIPNHDGEDSENWDAFYYPIGDARRAVTAFAALLRGQRPENAEVWPHDLLGPPA